jgi:hypothetical protein
MARHRRDESAARSAPETNAAAALTPQLAMPDDA